MVEIKPIELDRNEWIEWIAKLNEDLIVYMHNALGMPIEQFGEPKI